MSRISRRSRIRTGVSGCLAACLVAVAPPAHAAPSVAVAPGGPGAAAFWTTGDKEGLGTSASTASKVWYTLTGGTMSEVYYPSGATPNVRQLQFAVTDGATSTQLESDSSVTRAVALADQRSLTYRQTSTDRAGRWQLVKTYVTDPARNTVLVQVSFRALKPGNWQLFALYDPSLAGDAGNDQGHTVAGALVASDDTHTTHVSSALVSASGFSATSTGYVGSSDGQQDLRSHHRLTATYAAAGPGNIAQVGRIPLHGGTGTATTTTLALGFGANDAAALAAAHGSLSASFTTRAAAYQAGWHRYTASLKKAPRQLTGGLATQYWASVMTVKAHEDKTHPGAFIASLTIPYGQVVSANGAGGGGNGYHFVWARDEYEQATGLLAAGDVAAARQAVRWLFTVQQQPDGHFPQDSTPDGTPDQTNVQLDETAYPLVLAQQAGVVNRALYRDHIVKAANYLVANGPVTPQERWEETGGYSPSTIADEIAGLTCAANLARRFGDTAHWAIWQATADQWQRSIEKWTYTTTGNLSDGQYYIRISASGDPNDGATRSWANGAGVHPENAVTDAGFLELVRLGVKQPSDPYVAHSLVAVDQSLKVHTPVGDMFHRYTFDGYGETADGGPWTGTGIGRAWPLLSGERGEYVVARGGNAMSYLRTMAGSANKGYMIPEQAWDVATPTAYHHVFGKGTGSAAPLAWAMSQYVRLAQDIGAHRLLDRPAVVAARYAGPRRAAAPRLTLASPQDLTTATGRTTTVRGTTTASRVYVSVNGAVRQIPVTGGVFNTTVTLTGISNQIVVAAVSANGTTAQTVRTVTSFGTRLGTISDPTGDDNGPGSYVYPTDGAFNKGSFDLTGFSVYTDGTSVRMVTSIAGDLQNPWGGQGISTQRLNIYLRTPSATGTTSLLPGTNMRATAPWTRAIVVDGRHQTSTYGEGVYDSTLHRTAAATLDVLPTTHQIVVTIAKSALGSLDLRTAGYQVSIFSDADDTEGIGNVRPVYSLACWQGTGCPSFVGQYRFGGGAGIWDPSLPSVDTDTNDPNAIDIINGTTPQATALAYSPTAQATVPYVTLH